MTNEEIRIVIEGTIRLNSDATDDGLAFAHIPYSTSPQLLANRLSAICCTLVSQAYEEAAQVADEIDDSMAEAIAERIRALKDSLVTSSSSAKVAS